MASNGPGPNVHPMDQGRAKVGPQQAGGHGQGGGLAGTVGTDHPVEGTRGHFQADAIDGDLVTEALGQATDGQGGQRRTPAGASGGRGRGLSRGTWLSGCGEACGGAAACGGADVGVGSWRGSVMDPA